MLWDACISQLANELPAQQLNTWIRPLQPKHQNNTFCLYAPNKFVLDWVQDHYRHRIQEILRTLGDGDIQVEMKIGSHSSIQREQPASPITPKFEQALPHPDTQTTFSSDHNLKPEFTFETFVEGKSNQLARAASIQVANRPGHTYNPLFLYAGVGLGKTHLMHAIGNYVLSQNPAAKVCYLASERFVSDMVRALQIGKIDDFKKRYRSLDVLLIDDIQFFAKKERSQEEFFHTFNTLVENNKQVVLTCDSYPKEISGLEDRLKSRFGWGLPVALEPPDLETRVAILLSKAAQFGMELPSEVAFFMGNRIRSNVRELEGALRRVIANAQFTGKPITLELTKEALRDLIALQDKRVSIDNIIKVVAEFFKIRVSDIVSAKRTRTIARPRQIAMALAKELTNHSLPEIGMQFGGRDHTTVLHAHRKVAELRQSDQKIDEDFKILLRTLSH